MSDDITMFSLSADLRTLNRETRRGYNDAIGELIDALADSSNENDALRTMNKDLHVEVSRLRSAVSNFEKIISARDRFGCWLCAKHEREGIQEDNSEEKEVLRNENLALRGEIKRLERVVIMMQQDRSPGNSHLGSRLRPAIRSSVRSSDEGDRQTEGRRIRFSQRQSISSDRRVDRSSISSTSKKVSLDAPPSPEHKKSPLLSFTSAALVMNAVQSLKSGLRKSRSKQALFSGSSSRPAWAVKFSSLERQLSSDEIDLLVKVMSRIKVCDSVDDLHAIAASMTPVKVGPGDTVCKQGEGSLFFMVISDGEFLCESIGAPTRELGPEDYFGEEIFVHPFPVSAISVTCTSPEGGTLWGIHTDALRHVLKTSGIRQTQIARETLDCCPKILRDSINASQFASICRSATLVTQRPIEPGLLVVVEAPDISPRGSIVIGDMPIDGLGKYLFLSQREIDSIPPLAVAIASMLQQTPSNKQIIEGTCAAQTVSSTPMSTESEDRLVVPHHPLSPSLRPNLT
jgi:CRP-like cAMP-binding protein